jgi:hypothetical protein
MRQVSYSKLGLALILTGISVCSQAQTLSTDQIEPNIIIRVENLISEKEDASLSKPLIAEVRSAPEDCDQKYPMPEVMGIKQVGQEEGAKVCTRLVLQGQRLQCEVDKLTREQSNMVTSVGTKTELTNWTRCNQNIANLLVNGYYLPASEIERRLQICRSNFYADPGKPPRSGKLIRFMDFAFKDVNPSSDAALEASIKLSTPINSIDNTAGLMKCEWMFATSKTPQIDPLPNLTPTTVAKPSSPVKAPVKKTP